MALFPPATPAMRIKAQGSARLMLTAKLDRAALPLAAAATGLPSPPSLTERSPRNLAQEEGWNDSPLDRRPKPIPRP
jgi:hypothetical protein